MTRERKIEILIKDRCTKSEAIKYLENGTTVYEDFEENFELYMEEWKNIGFDEEEYAEMVNNYKEMIKTGIPCIDWGVVKDDGHTYYIEYVN